MESFDGLGKKGLLQFLRPLLNLPVKFGVFHPIAAAMTLANDPAIGLAIDLNSLLDLQQRHEDDPSVCVNALLDRLLRLPSDLDWYPLFVRALREQGLEALVAEVQCEHIQDLPHFCLLMRSFTAIQETIKDPGLLLPYLSSTCCLKKEESERLARICSVRGPTDGLRGLLAIITRGHTGWFLHFIAALKSTKSPPYLQLAETLLGKSQPAEDDVDSFSACFGCETKDTVASCSSANGCNDVEEEQSSSEPEDEAEDSVSSKVVDGEFHPEKSVKAEPFVLRKYQKELVQPALDGSNTTICAPTGSGKTIVAAEIIKQHLEGGADFEVKAKVMFFVPTTQLVEQQASMLYNYLPGDRFSVVGLCGTGSTTTSKTPKSKLIKTNDVIVMTPALMINCMNFPNEQDRIRITDFSMLVFDECHHTTKLHMYKQIMDHYFELKLSGDCDGPLPQVICLTASLGVGKSDKLDKAVDYVLDVCANMDAAALVTVVENLDEMADFVYMPKDTARLIEPEHDTHEFAVQTELVMAKIEERLGPLLTKAKDGLLNQGENLLLPSRRWSQEYTGWIGQLRSRAPRLDDSALKNEILSCVNHLHRYHNALTINSHVTTKQAIDYLKAKLGEFQRRADDRPIDVWLCGLFAGIMPDVLKNYALRISSDQLHNACANRLAQELKRLIQEEYARNEDCRVIVFAMTRHLVLALEEFMKEDPYLANLNPCHLVSINVGNKEGGQTEREQQDLINDFKDGRRKIMIATTVAEEGLDIAKCNLIVKYNHVTNEIALVQRRGRGRAQGSRSVLLTCELKIHKKEIVNTLREDLMREAIAKIRADHKHDFAVVMHERQVKAFEQRKKNKALQANEQKLMINKKFRILCGKCDAFLCASSDVRSIQSFFTICNGEIWSCVRQEPKTVPLSFETISVQADLSCAVCRTNLGVVVKYQNVYFPSLKAAGLAFDPVADNSHPIQSKGKTTAKKWKDVTSKLFLVQKLQDKDLFAMHEALKNLPTVLAQLTSGRALYSV